MSVTIVVRKLDLKNLFYRGNQMYILNKCHTPLIYESKAFYQKWFRSNITSTNPLVDGPDYTFLDGRRTPLRPRQRRRAQGQKEQVTRALQFMKQMDFAVERHKNANQEKLEDRRKTIEGKFKEKNISLDVE
ncbi:UNVERIFIED_CONTAM: hypothetical protein RMT77_005991 [Armadillidium vulgare]